MTETEIPEAAPPSRRKALWIGLAVVLVVALLVGGFFIARQHVSTQYLAGLIAYDQLDSKEALEIFSGIARFPGFICSEVELASEKVAELEAYQSAESLSKAAQYDQAIESYHAFYREYSDSSFRAASHQAIQDISFEWAESAADPAAALTIYEQIMAEDIYTIASKDKATGLMSPLYLVRGEEYLAAGDYGSAISDLINAYQLSKDSAVRVSTEKLIRQAYQDAIKAAEKDDLPEEQAALLQGYYDFLVQENLSGTGSVAAELADAYLALGKSLFTAKDYQGAVDAYQSALEYSGDTNRATLEENIGSTYVSWANQLLSEGKETAATEKYIILVTEYPHTKAPASIDPAAAPALVAYGDTQLDAPDYEQAALVYRAVIHLSEVITDDDLLAKAYYGLAMSSYHLENYLEAAASFQAARDLVTDSDLLAEIETAQADALKKLGQSDDPFGQIVIQAATVALLQGEETMLFPYCIVIAGEEVCITREEFAVARMAIGTDPAEELVAVSGGEYRNEMLATTPGNLHYIVSFERETILIRECSYQGWHRIKLTLDLYRAKITVKIFDAATSDLLDMKEFLGENPYYCPSYYLFNQLQDSFIGGNPPAETMNDWIDSVIK